MAQEEARQGKHFDQSLSVGERIQALLSEMSLDEKCSQLLADSPAIDRLGVPAYHWWNECLHGVARAGRATVFPQAIGLAATFDPGLIRRIGAAIAEEGRAKYNVAVKAGMRGQYRGLTFWTPNINIFRDPRWGRGQETYGEDPFLTGELGAAFVEGLQQREGGYLKAAACSKHYAVHSGPEAERHTFNAVVSPKDLWETYLPAFERLVEAGVESVMGAYNRTNDEPCCGSKLLLEDILRGQWGFKGHVVSDCGAIGDFHDHHKVTGSAEESSALAVKRGCDLNCGSTYEALPAALEQGLLSEADVEASLRRLLATRFALGQFDREADVPFNSISTASIRSEAHVTLAREAAEKSMVLLKNNGVLPMLRGDEPKRIFLTGHNAANIDVMLGNYYGITDSVVTILEGLAAATPEHFTLEYRLGMVPDRPNNNPIDWAIPGKFDSFDAIIAVAGLVPMLEGEEGEAILSKEKGDRVQIGLPEHQVDRLKKLKATGHPLVVVLAGGSPVAIPEVHEIADAIIYMWYPGEQGGAALARLIFGDVSPSGKLPVTFPKSVDQLPPFDDYRMAGRTYRFMTEKPLYPFGFGLSYTSFSYANVQPPQSLSVSDLESGKSVTVKVNVANEGHASSAEVAQLYLRRPGGDPKRGLPVASLCAVSRAFIPAGKSIEVEFLVPARAFLSVAEDGSRRFATGEVELVAGSCSPGERGIELGAPAPAVANISVVA